MTTNSEATIINQYFGSSPRDSLNAKDDYYYVTCNKLEELATQLQSVFVMIESSWSLEEGIPSNFSALYDFKSFVCPSECLCPCNL